METNKKDNGTFMKIKSVQISQSLILVLFLIFGLISSLWISVGTSLINKYVVGDSGMMITIALAILLTVAFGWIVTKMHLSLTYFEV